MKKLILLLICSAFSVITNAQTPTLYVTNSISVANKPIDVQGIAKLTSTCITTTYCAMNDMMGIASQGGMANQAYTGTCTSTPNINLTVFRDALTYVTIQYCGTPQSGTWAGGVYNYSLDVIPGQYPDLQLTIW
jgi:hypothetical protein